MPAMISNRLKSAKMRAKQAHCSGGKVLPIPSAKNPVGKYCLRIREHSIGEDTHSVGSRETLCFVDVFAGCGGLSLGLKQAGWNGLFAIEKNANAFETLDHNFRDGARYGYQWPQAIERKPWDISFIYLWSLCSASKDRFLHDYSRKPAAHGVIWCVGAYAPASFFTGESFTRADFRAARDQSYRYAACDVGRAYRAVNSLTFPRSDAGTTYTPRVFVVASPSSRRMIWPTDLIGRDVSVCSLNAAATAATGT